MAQNLRLALFDYDGTIVDSAIMIVEGAIAAFRICGLPDPDPAKVRENIGKPLAIALDEYMPPGFNVNATPPIVCWRSSGASWAAHWRWPQSPTSRLSATAGRCRWPLTTSRSMTQLPPRAVPSERSAC